MPGLGQIRRFIRWAGTALALAVVPSAVLAQDSVQDKNATFLVNPPGVLKKNWGHGIKEYTLYAKDMTHPIKGAMTTPNSQIHGVGGMFSNKPGGQCAAENFDEVWWDTYCEKRGARGRKSICDSASIHQGIDIRGGTSTTCREFERTGKSDIELVAAYDGTISYIGTFSVSLRADRGGTWKYLHPDMKRLKVKRGDRVKAGQTIAYLDNDFGKSWTTQHLHLEHWVTLRGTPPRRGTVPVPLYCDLVLAYERASGKTAVMVGGGQRCDGGQSAPPPTPAPDTAAAPPQPESPADQEPSPGTAAPPTATPARYVSYWDHGESRVGLIARGDERTFEYVTPRSGLPSDLVKPGTVLFEGRKSDNTYEGTAYVFNRGCGAQGYAVRGLVQSDGTRVVLTGQRPVPGPDTCTPQRFYNDRLVFSFLESATPSPPQSAEPAPPAAGAETSSGTSAAPTAPVTPPPAIISDSVSMRAAALAKPVCTRARCVDRDAFMQAYAPIYRREQGTDLNLYRVAALNSVLNVWDTRDELEGDRRLAYILATVYHESFHFIYPIRECKCVTDEGSVACVRKLHAKGIASAYHRRDPVTRESYYGRGQTQLTLDDNYKKITRFLKLDVDLYRKPDEALGLAISARNAVLGLYNGWYRYRNNRPIALKDNAFANDSDWLRARDVLIAQRRHADRVALHGKKISAILDSKFISRTAFDAKYGAAASSPPPAAEPASAATTQETPLTPPDPQAADASPAPGPTPVAPPSAGGLATEPQTAPPAPPATAAPAPTPVPITDPILAELTAGARALESRVASLQTEAQRLGVEAVALRSKLEVYAQIQSARTASGTKSAPGDGTPAADLETLPKGVADTVDPTVDFKTRWPPSHKALGRWCSASDMDRKSVEDLSVPVDDDEKEFLSRFVAGAYGAEPGAAEVEIKGGEIEERLVLTSVPLRPEPLAAAATPKSAAAESAPLPPLPQVRDSGVTLSPLKPERGGP